MPTRFAKAAQTIDRYGTRNRRLSDNLAAYTTGPMARLWLAMQRCERVWVITRGMREIRALLTGRLVAFDRSWNLVSPDIQRYFIFSCIHLPCSKSLLYNFFYAVFTVASQLYQYLRDVFTPGNKGILVAFFHNNTNVLTMSLIFT
ncbi:unnamed protein product [Protopolystoma xenopodis]|uniref:Uncharacterized protein n=1 Tax=Protopolystoma xenopodis TaxID=117903 RepID=A0A448WQZ2_9PLAT|nr:unnamed protein product [Protopolystoma xenopodis]